MKSKTFYILLAAILSVCAILTVAHLAYAVYAYNHCSIIYFIAKELW